MLKAPTDFWHLSDKERQEILNECGPSGAIANLIPNHLLGLKISEVCNIHDYMFINAKSKDELKIADEVFLENMMTKIEEERGAFSLGRKLLAYVYFVAVRIYSWFH